MWLFDLLWFIFTMVTMRGSRLGADRLKRPRLTNDEVCKMITTLVTMVVRAAIPKTFGPVKTSHDHDD